MLFNRVFWAKIWHSILAELAEDTDFEEVFINSTIMRVRQHADGSPLKTGNRPMRRSRGGLTTKMHALVDGLGFLVNFSLINGQARNAGETLPLFAELKLLNLAPDKAYDTNAILQHLKSLGIQAVIPTKKSSRTTHTRKNIYASRNLIERFFSYQAI